VVELEQQSSKHSLTLLVGLYQVRANQEEKLKPYVVELENSIKQKLDKAKQAKEKQEEMLMEKLAEHTRSVCVKYIYFLSCWVQCCGSVMFIPDPNFFLPESEFFHPGSASKTLVILTQKMVFSLSEI
jgi:hypothetical protein